MDTMDILMDMGMDITVDKHNNQNAKICLERTPELSSSNFNQKNKLHQIVRSRSKNVKSTQQNFTMLVHISPLLFSPFAKKKHNATKFRKKKQLKYELLTVNINVICYR